MSTKTETEDRAGVAARLSYAEILVRRARSRLGPGREAESARLEFAEENILRVLRAVEAEPQGAEAL